MTLQSLPCLDFTLNIQHTVSNCNSWPTALIIHSCLFVCVYLMCLLPVSSPGRQLLFPSSRSPVVLLPNMQSNFQKCYVHIVKDDIYLYSFIPTSLPNHMTPYVVCGKKNDHFPKIAPLQLAGSTMHV